MTTPKKVEIMDTTLRDGEQTSGVSFTAPEKLTIAKLLLEELKVDRIEIASTRVSEGEFNAVKEITAWARDCGLIDKIEVLSFVDRGLSIDWMQQTGAEVQNLLTKGSLNHLEHQLKQSPEQHFQAVSEAIHRAAEVNIATNVYLEDWSNGMRNSKAYAMEFIDHLSQQPISRLLLPDTLGVLTPDESYAFVREVKEKHPELHVDFHAHNDYDLGVANVLSALKAGADGLHLTMNGMGERAGNAPLASVVAVINDFLPNVHIDVQEKSLYSVSKLVENFSGFRIPENKPVLGDNVFTQTAGIHADGDNKNNLYFNDLLPERFGRKRQYALGKTSGKANIQKNLQELGLHLSEDEILQVTKRIIELGDKKEVVTREDLPYIISDVLGSNEAENNITVESYVLTHAKGLRPTTTVSVVIDGELIEENAQGDGQFDAFMNTLKKIYAAKQMKLPKLVDYAVRIPPGSSSDALCETVITWEDGAKRFKTRGLDSDQTVSAIIATQKMLNIMANNQKNITVKDNEKQTVK